MADSEPDLAQVLETVQDIVRGAIEAGEITELTPRLVRTRTEDKLGLPSKILDGTEYKAAINKAITAITSSHDDGQPDTSTTKGKKRKSSDSKEGQKPNKRTKQPDASKDEGDKKPKKPRARKTAKQPTSELELGEDNSADKQQTKSTKVPLKQRDGKAKDEKPSSSTKGRKKAADSDAEDAPGRKRGKKFLSAAVVDSDTDMDVITTETTSKVDKPVSKIKTSTTKKNDNQKSSGKVAPTKPKSKEVTTESEEKPKPVSTVNDAMKGGDVVEIKSDSEMSVLNDEPPKRKKKSKGKTAESSLPSKKTTEPKASRSKKPVQVLSKDEETIKKLKSFVVACGVRKVWSREFKDLDTPSLQITRLKEILSDLGMTGRLSIEQARSIKAKREFAQELEDVKSFEQSVVGMSSRASRSAKDSSKPTSDRDDEERADITDEDEVPSRKRLNARKSITAFLGDQSDDE